jgi:hypothetical protein
MTAETQHSEIDAQQQEIDSSDKQKDEKVIKDGKDYADIFLEKVDKFQDKITNLQAPSDLKEKYLAKVADFLKTVDAGNIEAFATELDNKLTAFNGSLDAFSSQQQKEYEIQPGDYLSTIAQHCFNAKGEQLNWQNLYAGNKDNLKSKDPNLIYPGEKLKMPSGYVYFGKSELPGLKLEEPPLEQEPAQVLEESAQIDQSDSNSLDHDVGNLLKVQPTPTQESENLDKKNQSDKQLEPIDFTSALEITETDQKKQELLGEICQVVSQDEGILQGIAEEMGKQPEFAKQAVDAVLQAGGAEFQQSIIDIYSEKITIGDKIKVGKELGLIDSARVLMKNDQEALGFIIAKTAKDPKLMSVLLGVAAERGIAGDILQKLPPEVAQKMIQLATENPQLMDALIPKIGAVIGENPDLVQKIFDVIPNAKKAEIAEKLMNENPELMGQIMEKAMNNPAVVDVLLKNEKFKNLLVNICTKNQKIQQKLQTAMAEKTGAMIAGDFGKQAGGFLSKFLGGVSGLAKSFGGGKEIDEFKKELMLNSEIQKMALAEVRKTPQEYLAMLKEGDKVQIINLTLRDSSMAEVRNQMMTEMLKDAETRNLVIASTGNDIVKYLTSDNADTATAKTSEAKDSHENAEVNLNNSPREISNEADVKYEKRMQEIDNSVYGKMIPNFSKVVSGRALEYRPDGENALVWGGKWAVNSVASLGGNLLLSFSDAAQFIETATKGTYEGTKYAVTHNPVTTAKKIGSGIGKAISFLKSGKLGEVIYDAKENFKEEWKHTPNEGKVGVAAKLIFEAVLGTKGATKLKSLTKLDKLENFGSGKVKKIIDWERKQSRKLEGGIKDEASVIKKKGGELKEKAGEFIKKSGEKVKDSKVLDNLIPQIDKQKLVEFGKQFGDLAKQLPPLLREKFLPAVESLKTSIVKMTKAGGEKTSEIAQSISEQLTFLKARLPQIKDIQLRKKWEEVIQNFNEKFGEVQNKIRQHQADKKIPDSWKEVPEDNPSFSALNKKLHENSLDAANKPAARVAKKIEESADVQDYLKIKAGEQNIKFRDTGKIPAGEKISDGYIDGGSGTLLNEKGEIIKNGNREIILIDRKVDVYLKNQINYVKREFQNLPDKEKMEKLSKHIDDMFGGRKQGIVEKSDNFTDKFEGQSLLLGKIAENGLGVCRHRALMYKILGDEIGLNVSLKRGFMTDQSMGKVFEARANHAWNIVEANGEKYLVDVMQGKVLHANQFKEGAQGWYYSQNGNRNTMVFPRKKVS